MGGLSVCALKEHVNFQVPDLPVVMDDSNLIRFVLEYCASLVSPPKVDGEDEERSCIDVAAEIRSSQRDIVKILRESELHWTCGGPTRRINGWTVEDK